MTKIPNRVDRGKMEVIKQWPVLLMEACILANLLAEKGMDQGLANYKAGKAFQFSASDVGWARSFLGNVRHKFIQRYDHYSNLLMPIIIATSQSPGYYAYH